MIVTASKRKGTTPTYHGPASRQAVPKALKSMMLVLNAKMQTDHQRRLSLFTPHLSTDPAHMARTVCKAVARTNKHPCVPFALDS